jgi:hypothetical protein
LSPQTGDYVFFYETLFILQFYLSIFNLFNAGSFRKPTNNLPLTLPQLLRVIMEKMLTAEYSPILSDIIQLKIRWFKEGQLKSNLTLINQFSLFITVGSLYISSIWVSKS